LFDLRQGQERPRPFYAVCGKGLKHHTLKPFRVDGNSWLPGSWQRLFRGEILPSDMD
jgi:hypothetical protein